MPLRGNFILYPYSCDSCQKSFEIVKSMHDAAREEKCPTCDIALTRVWTVTQLIGTSVFSPEYNPGLGKVVYSKYHKEELCKKMGVTEIGNDYSSPEQIHKESDRKLEDRHNQSYETAMKEIARGDK